MGAGRKGLLARQNGFYTIEAALITGLMMVILMTLTIGLYREVYRGGLEAIFNYADDNWVFRTEAFNLKENAETQRLKKSVKWSRAWLMTKAESERRMMDLKFRNAIENSVMNRRLLVSQVVTELYEKKAKNQNSGQ